MKRHKKLYVALIIAVQMAFTPSLVNAKRCGNSYIRDDYTCHKGTGGEDGADAGAVFGFILGTLAVAGLLGLLVWAASTPSPQPTAIQPSCGGYGQPSCESISSDILNGIIWRW